MDLPKHGANPKYLYEQMQEPMPTEIIDFSVNLNPWGPPEQIFNQWSNWKHLIIDYPDPFGQKLTNKIASKESIASENILLGNGAAELIQLLAIFFREQKIGIFQPTFSEYERMTQAYGAEISYLSLDRLSDKDYLKVITQKQDAIFLCHPNNPTGETYKPAILKKLLNYCEKNHCYLIIDEAFYDFAEQLYSMVEHIESSTYLIILRSVTKMYAIAGLRLGQLFANPRIIQSLRDYQSYWSVNALALKIGELVIDENEFVQTTQKKTANIRQEILPRLKLAGFLVSNSQVNFFLMRDPALDQQTDLLTFLLKKGFIPRHTENYPGLDGCWLRIAIRPLFEMEKLLEALEEWKRI